MKKTAVWFGRMTHGAFVKGYDSTEMVIVHSIDHVEPRMTEEEADDYMIANNYDSYLMPDTFLGEIVYDDSHVILLNSEEEAV
jgi:hypothetical protein